ncbi:MAG: hypothetical protein ACE5E6_03095, partial [Phycisphaerae bacterium]
MTSKRGRHGATVLGAALIGWLAMAGPMLAAPAPPTDLTGVDAPNDTGQAIDLKWTLSPDDTLATSAVVKYIILRAADAAGPFSKVGERPKGSTSFRDPNCKRGKAYWYQVVGGRGAATRDAPPPPP